MKDKNKEKKIVRCQPLIPQEHHFNISELHCRHPFFSPPQTFYFEIVLDL